MLIYVTYICPHTDFEYAQDNCDLFFPMFLCSFTSECYACVFLSASTSDHYVFRMKDAETKVKHRVQSYRPYGRRAPAPPTVRYYGINHLLMPCKQDGCAICSKIREP